MLILIIYSKRKIIFDYLCDNLFYDFSLLEAIKNAKEQRKIFRRNLYKELDSVIKNKIGICNAISQYYKLLLEHVGVIAKCVVCDDGTSINHQLNIVYDKDNDCYSFDDVTSVIVSRGTKEDFFDYDINTANGFNQGNREVMEGFCWVCMPDNNINYLVGRELVDEEDDFNIPDNIISIKNKKINNIY